MSGSQPVSEYRFSQSMTTRFMGLGLALLGVFVFVLTAAVGVFDLPVAVLTAGVVLTVVAVFALGGLLSRRAWVVRLDETGYRVRFVRGVGVSRARWTDVEDVVAATVAGAPCVVLRLRSGDTSTVPVSALAGSGEDFVADLREHLNRGHGYRRIR